MSARSIDKARARKNLRTGLVLGLLALASLTAFCIKVWQLG